MKQTKHIILTNCRLLLGWRNKKTNRCTPCRADNDLPLLMSSLSVDSGQHLGVWYQCLLVVCTYCDSKKLLKKCYRQGGLEHLKDALYLFLLKRSLAWWSRCSWTHRWWLPASSWGRRPGSGCTPRTTSGRTCTCPNAVSEIIGGFHWMVKYGRIRNWSNNYHTEAAI